MTSGVSRNLPAPGGGHDPRGGVHRWAEIVALRGAGRGVELGFACVESQADAELTDLSPLFRGKAHLGLQGAGQGLARLKNGGYAVAGVLGDAAAVAVDQLAQDLVVAGNDAGHHPGVLFPKAGRALDVGEEENKHAGTPFPQPSFKVRGQAALRWPRSARARRLRQVRR